jgi:hypothetical protein
MMKGQEASSLSSASSVKYLMLVLQGGKLEGRLFALFAHCQSLPKLESNILGSSSFVHTFSLCPRLNRWPQEKDYSRDLKKLLLMPE